MRKIIGIITIIFGLVLIGYCSFWTLLVGGLEQFINIVKSTAPVDRIQIMKAIAKVVFSWASALFFVWALILPGKEYMENKS